MAKKFIVYKHTNVINHKIYVGITCQKPNRRWRNGDGYKKNKHFYDSIQKYGWNNFKHEILYDNLTVEQATSIEQELIKKYNTTDKHYGYNNTTGGDINYNYSFEARQNMSEHNARCWSGKFGKDNPHSIPVICLETKQIFDSLREASEQLNIDISMIIRVCKGKQLSAGSLHFRYYKDYDPNIEYNLNTSKTRARKVICLETKHIFNSITEAESALHLSNISSACCDTNKTRGNLHFKYLDEYKDGDEFNISKRLKTSSKPVFCLNNNICYESAKEASRQLNLTPSLITSVCMGKLKHTKGYVFKYYSEIKTNDRL